MVEEAPAWIGDAPEWAKSVVALVAAGLALAPWLRKWLVNIKMTGLDGKAADLQGLVLEQALEQFVRLRTEHAAMSDSLHEANEIITAVKSRMAAADQLLEQVRLLLVMNDIDVPEAVHEHFRREVI